MAFVVRLGKDRQKFSCSHFTIFGPNVAERLHGHNYYVSASLTIDKLDPDLGMVFDFNIVKPLISKICNDLDERVLVPEKSKHLKIKRNKEQIEITFQNKFYSLPAEDVILLPLVNVTAEELARYLTERLLRLLPKDIKPTRISVGVEETKGQSVTYTMKGI